LTSVNGLSNPAPAGGYIEIFVTGTGQVSPPIPTGQEASLTPLSPAQAAVTATIGTHVATAQFAGAGPLSVVDQLMQIPADLPPGDFPVVISVNAVQSNSALITVGPAVSK
jgi:uncharacterized protein (TIGR03437 family)